MPRCKTTFNAYSVKFSPFIENRFAVATAQNFGIIGNGRQHVFEVIERFGQQRVDRRGTCCRMANCIVHTLHAMQTTPFMHPVVLEASRVDHACDQLTQSFTVQTI